MRRILAAFSVFLLLLSCGPRKEKAVSGSAPATRPFPSVDAPALLDSPGERAAYILTHFWDRFTDTSRVYPCDSATVNGVSLDEVEAQVGLFTTLLSQERTDVADKAVKIFYDRLDAFQRAVPASNLFPQLVALTSRYLYDPNSPVRNEALYLPFVSRLATSDLVDPALHRAYAWDAEMCARNLPGTRAADFTFVDTEGRRRTLYGVKAEYILLVFANPGCQACRELTEAMAASPSISERIASGRLKVVDVYIDDEIGEWKAHVADYPSDWICGYDPACAIRTDLIYNVRAIPSIYLLDASKTVLLKDAPMERALNALAVL